MNELTRLPRVPRPSRVSAYFAGQLGPPVIDRATVTDILECYGIRTAGPSRNLRLARRSLNVAVATPSGKRVLKLYRPQWKPATVEYGHSILAPARGAERARRPSQPHDATVRRTSPDRIACSPCSTSCPGVNYSLNFLRRPDRLRLTVIAGQTLANLHSSVGEFTPAGEHHMGLVSTTGARRRDIAWHAAKLDELGARTANLADADARRRAKDLCDRSTWLLDEIDRLDTALDRAELPRLVIHGDYGLHNLIFQPTGAIPVDFELSRLDWRINDLVSALGKYRYRSGQYDFESMDTFMESYRRWFPLTVDEQTLLPDIWRLYKLQVRSAVLELVLRDRRADPEARLRARRDRTSAVGHRTSRGDRTPRRRGRAGRTMTRGRPITVLAGDTESRDRWCPGEPAHDGSAPPGNGRAHRRVHVR